MLLGDQGGRFRLAVAQLGILVEAVADLDHFRSDSLHGLIDPAGQVLRAGGQRYYNQNGEQSERGRNGRPRVVSGTSRRI